MTAAATETRHCDKHGPYEARHYFGGHWTMCSACRNEQEAEREERTRAEERKEYQDQLVLRSGLVGRYLQTTFDTFAATTKEQKQVHQACMAFAESFYADQGAGLFLIGPPGTGKTHLGAAMIHEVIRRHARSAVMASAREIVRDLRSTWRRDSSRTEDDVIGHYATSALLVLDEVGVGFASEGEQVQLFDVLDARYQRMLPTVVLSNLNLPLLRPALGDRLYDRLREGARVLVCDWPSHRGRPDKQDATRAHVREGC